MGGASSSKAAAAQGASKTTDFFRFNIDPSDPNTMTVGIAPFDESDDVLIMSIPEEKSGYAVELKVQRKIRALFDGSLDWSTGRRRCTSLGRA